MVRTLAVTSSPSLPSPRVARQHQLAILIAQAGRQPVDLGLGHDLDLVVFRQTQKRRTRATKSATSSSLKALSSDSIGTACRTLAKPPAGAAPTRAMGESPPHQIGKLRLDRVVAPAQRVVVGVADDRRVLRRDRRDRVWRSPRQQRQLGRRAQRSSSSTGVWLRRPRLALGHVSPRPPSAERQPRAPRR